MRRLAVIAALAATPALAEGEEIILPAELTEGMGSVFLVGTERQADGSLRATFRVPSPVSVGKDLYQVEIIDCDRGLAARLSESEDREAAESAALDVIVAGYEAVPLLDESVDALRRSVADWACGLDAPKG